jgi:outer membrane protein OmpA-like peptidoglycan-associated protein
MSKAPASALRAGSFGLVLALLGSVSAADAEESLHFDLQSFRAAATTGGLFTLEGTEIGAHLRPRGALQLGYAHHPLVYESSIGEVEAVRNRLGAELSGGIGLWNRVELALSLPAVLYQEGQSILGSAAPTAAGVGDLRFLPKVRIWGHGLSGLSVSALASLRLPTAGDQALAGAGVAVEPQALVAWRRGGLTLLGVLGYRAQARRQLYSLAVDDQLLLGVGARYTRGALSALAELTAATDAAEPFGRRQTSPVTATFGGRYLRSGWAFTVGAGPGLVPGFGSPRAQLVAAVAYAPYGVDSDRDGIPDPQDLCPLEPEDPDGFEDRDGCPDPDNDRDGVRDPVDRCPSEAEDRDGFEDSDGCPDPDNDKDGILDLEDRCPNQAEDRDGFEDGDGCPDPDNDGDGILDRDDACPLQAETRNGLADSDGCPETDKDGDGLPDLNDRCPDQVGPKEHGGCPDQDGDGVPDHADRCPGKPGSVENEGCPEARGARRGVRVQLRGQQIWTDQAIYFDHGKWLIKARFRTLLQRVAELIAKTRRIHVVYVEGHADGSGDEIHNQWLSFYRAKEVLLLLRKLGAPRFKVRALGRGAESPSSPEDTVAGRAENRRVVFHVEWRRARAAARLAGAPRPARAAKPAGAARPSGPEGPALERLEPLLRKLDRLGGKPKPGAPR